MNKTIGVLLLVVIGLAMVGGFSGAGDSFYEFLGLSFLVVGIWGGVLLIRTK